MSDHDTHDPESGRAIARALAAWTPLAPPADFADRVLATRPLAPQVAPTRRRWWLAAPVAAVATIVLVVAFAVRSEKSETATAAVERTDSMNGQMAAPQNTNVGVAPSAGSGTVAIGSGSATSGSAGLVFDDSTTELEIIAGTSATIHDPSPSTMLHVDVHEKCPSGARVTATRGGETITVAGKVRAAFTLGLGVWRYEVWCLDAPDTLAAKGTLGIRRDRMDRPLAKVVPTNTIDADGRTYRVSYQATVPSIRVKAPGATDVRYVAAASNEEKAAPVVNGLATLGDLTEGSYTFWPVSPTGAGKISTLKIDFDNTAPQIYLRSVRSAASGGSAVVVRGEVVPGWRLFVGGEPVTIKQGRFTTTVRGFSRIVIRAEHPSRGLHYLLTDPITR